MASKPRIFGQKHKKQKRQDRRKTANQRGYDRRWKRLRDEFIEQHPLCKHCEERGQVTMAKEIDHIIPFSDLSDPLRLCSDNLQSLCRRCHAIKTASEQRPGRGGPASAD